ncbi:hypothetical protein [Streptomyces sp. NPDC058103]|uniref:hypothetical protein n=1 Tax=Streptomyces sp. NPDC058103 TaxID=3346341 RepID=UPI0036E9A451
MAHRRHDASAHRGRAEAARRVLVAVLLAVLTVVGGVPAAAGSVRPAQPFAGAPPSVAYAPGAHRPSPHTDRTARTGTVHDLRRTRTVTAADRHRAAPPPAPQPRAGTDHARVPQPLPPPGPHFVLPSAPGVRAPHRALRAAPTAPARATDRFRRALPAVRGPPRTAVHRPPVLPPAPSHRPAGTSSPR